MRLILHVDDETLTRLMHLASDERRSAPAQAEVLLMEALGQRHHSAPELHHTRPSTPDAEGRATPA